MQMMSRRKLLLGSAALAVGGGLLRPAAARTGQIWGAIRWDAWWGTGGDALQGQAGLWAPQWQFRAPAWAKPSGPAKLTFAPTQASMDAEIAAASAAGLKYWAYDYYPTAVDADFMNGLKFHRSSSIRAQMNYCLIVQNGHWGGTKNFRAINASITKFAHDDFYQKVGGRPVIYIFWNNGVFESQYFSNYSNVAASVADLRAQMVAAGLATPYIVLMKQADRAAMTALGADALGSYAIGPAAPASDLPYPAFATQVQAAWAAQRATGANVVPTAMTGWDIRPLAERPPSWYKAALQRMTTNSFVAAGTDAEVASHVRAGVAFIGANPSQCPQKLGLIYSWDECSEGGNVIEPTIGNPAGTLLSAVGAAVA